MAMHTTHHKAVFRVLDVIDGPYEGRILKLRLHGGEAPTIRELKGARVKATSPDGGAECELRIVGFALFGGRPSDERLARTGRIDISVEAADGAAEQVTARWEVVGPI
ncbi:MAG: hypothetical protein BMS9Abin29_1579 [Gemmatimonadota bacterium]|nr:MAG: hypothetical protein BMS9Abin29_1579 [Gemmatimonadota bacterium]